jgi:hypothetical protein
MISTSSSPTGTGPKPTAGWKYLLGVVTFYVAYVSSVALQTHLYLSGPDYHGTPEQREAAFGMTVAHSMFWSTLPVAGQGLVMWLCARRARGASLTLILTFQITVAVLSVLLSGLVQLALVNLVLPSILTLAAYGALDVAQQIRIRASYN